MKELFFEITQNDLAENKNLRIDKFLCKKIGKSRNFIHKLFENQKIFINDNIAQKSSILKNFEKIKIIIPDAEKTDILPQNIPINIVFEDDDIIVINKPKNLVVHPSNGHFNDTLVNALLYHKGTSLSKINGKIRPGIVHRIDKNTTGLLVCAKNDFSHNRLSEQMISHSIKREYNAVVFNTFNEKNGKINAPIGRDKFNRKKMAVTTINSKFAITHFSVIKNYFNTDFGNCAHVKVNLETGRTHQIRVHMAYIGHPVCGDDVYGNGKPKFLNGQCLHAKTLEFTHPRTKKHMIFTSELPEYFTEFLNKLECNI